MEFEGALANQRHLDNSPRRRMPLVRVSYRSREHVFALAYPWGLIKYDAMAFAGT